MAGTTPVDLGGPSRWEREVMLKCAEANSQYMRATPAGQHYPRLSRFYARLADQGVASARAWHDGEPPPPHEPAVDAFWWGAAGWAVLFMTDVAGWSSRGAIPSGMLHHELQETFVRPHLKFAIWLNPQCRPPLYQIPKRAMHPDQLIIFHDYYWARQVIRLTVQWGLRQHLRDLPVLVQALALLRHLLAYTYGRPSPVGTAFLQSDLEFLRALFQHFGFSNSTALTLERFLVQAHASGGSRE